jgi:hypothetical protein
MDKITTTLFGVVAMLALPASAPARETLEWLTDNSESFNGIEERIQLRSAPRTSYSYTVPRNAAERARSFNLEYGATGHRWAIPVWMQPQYIGIVGSADTTITCDVDNYEFRNSSLALVYQSTTKWALVEIDTVGSGVLNLLAAVGTAFTEAYVMPVRVGFLRGGVTVNKGSYSEEADLRFVVEDNLGLTVADPAQFLSNDIYYDEQLSPDGDKYASAITNREDLADYQLGLIDRQTPWNYSRVQQNFARVFETPEEIQAFREWLHRRVGRYRSFWMPSFENDLRKTNTGTVTTTLRWKRDGYDNWSNRTHIAIELKDGSWLPRTLSAISAFDSTTMQATLNTTINTLASNIRRISFLGLKRLASDTVQLDWIGNSVAKCNYSVIEISP